MEISKQLRQGIYEVALSGRFTFSDHAQFRELLQHISEDGVRGVALNMAKVEYVDSAALGMLLLARDLAEERQSKLTITGAEGQVKKMFELSQFNTIFTMS